MTENNPSWSPDGSAIAYGKNSGNLGEIYIMNADGTGQEPLTSNNNLDESPSWSPFLPARSLVAISVTPPNPSIAIGEILQFTATGIFADNSTANLTGSVIWTSSNSSVATINAAGLATAIAAGITNITATAGGISGSATLRVKAGKARLLLLPASPAVGVNVSFDIAIQVQANGEAINGVSAYLDFDPAYLRVNSITPAADWSGRSYTILESSTDNSLGQINFSGGIFGANVTGNFTIATISFVARALTPGTGINFHFAPPANRNTALTSGENSVFDSAVGATARVKSGNADLALLPASQTVSLNSTFTVDIQVRANGEQVAGVQAYLDFDSSKLQVQSITSAAKWAGVNAMVMDESFDNSTGQVNYGGGVTSAVTGNFTVTTITFLATDAAANTEIGFHFTPPLQRDTAISDSLGNALLDTVSSATVAVLSGVAVDISVTLQGGQRPSPDGWEIPLTVKFFTANTSDVLTAQPIYSFTQTTTKSGSFTVTQVTGITPGTYDITVKSEHTLVNVKRSVVISTPVSINMGTLLEGNAKEDTPVTAAIINIYDFGVLSGSWQKQPGDVGFVANADFDHNGIINIYDFGLLSGSWQMSSPIVVQ